MSARFKKSGQPFVVEEVEPSVSYNEVMVEISAAGICGTDVHYRKGEFSQEKAMSYAKSRNVLL